MALLCLALASSCKDKPYNSQMGSNMAKYNSSYCPSSVSASPPHTRTTPPTRTKALTHPFIFNTNLLDAHFAASRSTFFANFHVQVVNPRAAQTLIYDFKKPDGQLLHSYLV